MEEESRTKRVWSRGTAGVLALLLGCFGVHRFYQGRWKSGILFLLFFWTGIPGVLGLMEGVHLICADEEVEEQPA